MNQIEGKNGSMDIHLEMSSPSINAWCFTTYILHLEHNITATQYLHSSCDKLGERHSCGIGLSK